MSRLDGELGDAAEHLEQAAGAGDSSVIRVSSRRPTCAWAISRRRSSTPARPPRWSRTMWMRAARSRSLSRLRLQGGRPRRVDLAGDRRVPDDRPPRAVRQRFPPDAPVVSCCRRTARRMRSSSSPP
jgi:hypothetical protein